MLKEAAAQIASQLQNAVQKNGQASLIVSGGSSPLPIFEALASLEMDWSNIMVSLVDDRLVPDTDQASNVGLIKDKLLKGPVRDAHFISLKEADLSDYEAYLPFDVMLLGMGPDGHFASLFPDMIGDETAFSPDVLPAILTTPAYGNPKVERITMNMALILQSASVYMIISGAEKKAVWQAAQTDRALPIHYLQKQQKTPLNKLESA